MAVIEGSFDLSVGCPDDTTDCVATTVPSFANDVLPVITQKCGSCHVEGGQAADRLLTSYDQVVALKGATFTAVYGCVMPPPADTVDQLLFTERTAIIQWLACGTPNN